MLLYALLHIMYIVYIYLSGESIYSLHASHQTYLWEAQGSILPLSVNVPVKLSPYPDLLPDYRGSGRLPADVNQESNDH